MSILIKSMEMPTKGEYSMTLYVCDSEMIRDATMEYVKRHTAEEEHTMDEFMYGQEGNPNDGSM